MVIRDNDEIKTKDEDDIDSLPLLEDVDDEECVIQGELLVAMRTTLSVQVKRR